MTAALPEDIAAALAGGKPASNSSGKPRMPTARLLRSSDDTSVLQDVAGMASAALRRPTTAVEIVFSSGKRPGHHYSHVNVLGAAASIKPLPFTWPAATAAVCLHCDGAIEGRPFPAVTFRDAKSGAYVPAQGLFCTTGCALAWIEDDFRGDKTSAAMWTRDVLTRYFGCSARMYRAPPRVAHAKYSHTGAGLSHAEFTGRSPPSADGTRPVFAAYYEPPFVTFAAVIECRDVEARDKDAAPQPPKDDAMGEVRGLRRPTTRVTPLAEQLPTGKPPLILAFLAQKARERRSNLIDDAPAPADAPSLPVGAAEAVAVPVPAPAPTTTDADGVAPLPLTKKSKPKPSRTDAAPPAPPPPPPASSGGALSRFLKR